MLDNPSRVGNRCGLTLSRPDYSKPIGSMSEIIQSPLDHLIAVYGEDTGTRVYTEYRRLVEKYRALLHIPEHPGLSERDAVMITYGDQVRQPGIPHLQSLTEFCTAYVQGTISAVHILPFFPYSSDDGFSVIDYRQVDPGLGTWQDIESLGKRFKLMFDAVINHISAGSDWFDRFLQDEPPYTGYFIVIEGDPDLSAVVRPRALPLLSSFTTPSGEKKVWTTFSDDQVDLNYRNPLVLIEILDTLLFYVLKGASLIRLDAIAYLWKEIGTACIHLPQTHQLVQLMRAALDDIAPHVQIITETNVPHDENISYFGDGINEAGLVYNFALPPLVLHTLRTGDSTAISRWASGLSLPPSRVTFFNFLASHDGIGVTPAKGLISPDDIQALVDLALAHDGKVSYRSNPDSSQSPYELNINYFDALSDPSSEEAQETQVDRFIAAHAIMFSLVGVPGIYFHSLTGSRGWADGILETGRNRTINRQKLELVEIKAQLANPASLRAKVFQRLIHLLEIRASQPAFNPYGRQQVLDIDGRVFAVRRISPGGEQGLLCLQNISTQKVTLPLNQLDLPQLDGHPVDLVANVLISPHEDDHLKLHPYQTIWIAPGRGWNHED